MTTYQLLMDLHRQGFTLTPLPDGKLEVRPASKLPEDLRQEIKEKKPELLALLTQPVSFPWPCPHCGHPAEIEDVCPSLDGQRMLTLWHCEPCQTYAATPDDIKQPPTWVSRSEQ